jgi:molybdopterin molybdotransferase
MERSLTTREALASVLAHVKPSGITRIPLSEALGLAVAEDICATENVPPFTNSAMDGFAIRSEDSADARSDTPVSLRVLGDVPAGQVASCPVEAGSALRIMTGAPLPEGADAVVPVENTRSGDNWVELHQPVWRHAEIRFAGEDIREGTCVVESGVTLNPGEIGVLAAIGCAEVPVRMRTRVAVLTTGDELVDASEKPGPGQIRDANIHAVCAQLSTLGAQAIPFPRVPDTRESVEHVLREAMATSDMILTTGGISVGDYDFVKDVLEDLGVKRIFWRVAQKPGGPLGFWMLGEKPVFGIPGNPVAAMLMVEEYVRPALRKMMGFKFLYRPEARGQLDEAWNKSKPDGKQHTLRVRAGYTQGIWHASLTGPQGSGILSSMMRANALAIIPEDVNSVQRGGEVLLRLTSLTEDH